MTSNGMYKVNYKGLPYQVGQITNAASQMPDICRYAWYLEFKDKEDRLKCLDAVRQSAIKMIEENYEFFKAQIEGQPQ